LGNGSHPFCFLGVVAHHCPAWPTTAKAQPMQERLLLFLVSRGGGAAV
jgi:hypothetical protein